MRRVIFDNFDVGDQSHTGVRALNQVMAEQSILREPAIEHAVDRFGFENALAGKNGLSVEVLIDVRHRARVNVETGLTRVDVGETRSRGALNADAHTRLQNPVTSDDYVLLRIDNRLIQRMSKRGDKLVGCTAREFRISVERDYVSNFCELGDVAGLEWKAVVLTEQ